MWSQNKKCDIAQQYDWQFIAILESSFLAISMFCRATSITGYSDDVRVTKWSMTSSFTNWARFLKLLHLFNWNGRGPYHDIPSLVWIIPPRKWWLHGICRSQAKSLEPDRCWWANLSGRRMSILVKTLEQLMLQRDLARQNNCGFSIESHLLIQLSSQFWNPRQNLQSFTSS